jgi:predicted DNA-binding ribbon-helix-helix protein
VPATVLQFRPSLMPTWDVREQALAVLVAAGADTAVTVATVAAEITPGRPNEDDHQCLSSALQWCVKRRLAAHTPANRHADATFRITAAGIALAATASPSTYL